jgi:hypothetical protein
MSYRETDVQLTLPEGYPLKILSVSVEGRDLGIRAFGAVQLEPSGGQCPARSRRDSQGDDDELTAHQPAGGQLFRLPPRQKRDQPYGRALNDD